MLIFQNENEVCSSGPKPIYNGNESTAHTRKEG